MRHRRKLFKTVVWPWLWNWSQTRPLAMTKYKDGLALLGQRIGCQRPWESVAVRLS